MLVVCEYCDKPKPADRVKRHPEFDNRLICQSCMDFFTGKRKPRSYPKPSARTPPPD